MYFVCKKEVDEVKVQLVGELGVELLILGIDRLEVYLLSTFEVNFSIEDGRIWSFERGYVAIDKRFTHALLTWFLNGAPDYASVVFPDVEDVLAAAV